MTCMMMTMIMRVHGDVYDGDNNDVHDDDDVHDDVHDDIITKGNK
jgi:hypothetical protein